MNKVKRIKELVDSLNEYRDYYYNNSESKISDYEYDTLFDELKQLEDESGFIMANSPTRTVGYEVKSALKKIKHSHPMLSLDKTKSVEDLVKFIGDKDYVLSCKMDGLTILLTYDNGELISAETRGNGEIGEDVTHNAKVFSNIPLTIPYKEHFEIKGEAIITYSDFEKINSKLPEDKKYKNPRNLVSGSVRQLDNRVCKDRNVKFIVWELPEELSEYTSGFEYAKSLGFEIVPYVSTNDTRHMEYLIDNCKRIASELSYPIDGLVCTYNDVKYGRSLGVTGHHPKHSLAFKFYDEEMTTTLRNIEWTMGKTGILTPVAVFDPVEIEGTIVEKASVHNVSILTDLDLNQGDTITVYKSNMIIPQIRENLSSKSRKTSYIKIPGTCPICNAATELKKDNETTVLYCTNPECHGKLLGKLSHFTSKNAMNIDGLSEQTLNKFINLGWLNSFIDIYNLSDHKDEMYKLDGFGKKSVDKLLDSIEKSRNTTLDRFIYALSIPLIGKSASKTIARYFGGNAEELYVAWVDFDFSTLEDFGEIMNKSIQDYFRNNFIMISDLIDEFVFKDEEKKSSNIDLSNKVFVITGSFEKFANRNELVGVIESYGGKVSGSVSTKTSYLLNNDINSNSSKNRKAKELGIPIITEEDFMKMIRE